MADSTGTKSDTKSSAAPPKEVRVDGGGNIQLSMGGAAPPPKRLAPLREDLKLYSGPRTREGQPTWTLHDPLSNRFFRIGWLQFEILSRWKTGFADAIAEMINKETTLHSETEDVMEFAKFCVANGLFPARGPAALASLSRQAAFFRKHWVIWLVKNYLFFRIPLVRPDNFLGKTLPFVRWMMNQKFLATTAVIGVIGILMVIRQWDLFVKTLVEYFSLEGVVLMGIAIGLSKIIHELAHGYVCKAFNCRVPSMGIAFLVMWPVLYTHSTDAWKLPSRRQRLLIGAAGIIIELSLAAYATMMWVLLPDGAMRSAAFTLATATWVMTLAINLNPFMRFDGYYLTSDFLRIPNLHNRSFNLGCWRMRRFLFGLDQPIPEKFPDRTYYMLLLISYGTWIYRFFLFMGIAILVYYLFTKVLGVILFIVEIVYFVGMPIYKELKAWYGLREEMTWNKHTITLVSVCSAVFLLAVIPWRTSIEAPSILRAQEYTTLFAPRSAKMVTLARLDQSANKGDVLFLFDAPDVNYRIKEARSKIQALQMQMQYQRLTNQLAMDYPKLVNELNKANTELTSLQEEKSRLTVRAPYRGKISDVDEELIAGSWVRKDQALGFFVDKREFFIEAFISEGDVQRLDADSSGWFYPDAYERDPLSVKLEAVDTTSLRRVPPYVAVPNGGEIPVSEKSLLENKGVLVPETSVYRIRLAIDDSYTTPNRIIRGWVLLRGKRQSFAYRLWRHVYGVLIRESTF